MLIYYIDQKNTGNRRFLLNNTVRKSFPKKVDIFYLGIIINNSSTFRTTTMANMAYKEKTLWHL